VVISLDGHNSTVATIVAFSMSDAFDEQNDAFTICACACPLDTSAGSEAMINSVCWL
jgi:hypothetical protein